MVFRQMAQITLKAEPLYIVTHIADEPVVNGNSVIMVRHAIKSCEAGKSKIQGRIQDFPSRAVKCRSAGNLSEAKQIFFKKTA